MFKNLLITSSLLASMASFAADKIEADPSQSKIVYMGKKVIGPSQHKGEVKVSKGTLIFDKGALKGGEIEADMTTINNTDLTDPEYNQKFVGHMKSEDFFAVDKFNTSKILIKKVQKLKGNDYKVTADLTIKNITAPITFNATATKEKAIAKLVFDRTKYDIKYGSGKFFQGLGDKMIHDDVELDVDLTMKQ